MTEDFRKVIDSIRRGDPIECSADDYSKIRATIILFALDCAESNDSVRMQTALAEVRRLDKQHHYGHSAGSQNRLT